MIDKARMKKVLKSTLYKGCKITLFEDAFWQVFAIIDNDESKLYSSISDAKRVINGKEPKYEIL